MNLDSQFHTDRHTHTHTPATRQPIYSSTNIFELNENLFEDQQTHGLSTSNGWVTNELKQINNTHLHKPTKHTNTLCTYIQMKATTTTTNMKMNK